MSYSTDFVNNKLYGADDMNKVRTTIMTEGIIKKGDADCLVTYLADGINIEAGEALFNDGCRIEVTGAETIAHDGSDCFVYFDRNYYGEPKADKGNTLPENCIPLAQITGGQVVDLRNFATLKIPSMGINRYLSKELNLDFEKYGIGTSTRSITFEDRTDIKYLSFVHHYGKYASCVFIDFEGGLIFGQCNNYAVYSENNSFILHYLGLGFDVSKTGNTVTFTIYSNTELNLGPAVLTAM